MPCIKKLPLVQRWANEKDVRVVLYNVDEAEPGDRRRVLRVLAEQEIREPVSSYEGKGKTGELFRMIGSMPGNSMSWGLWAWIGQHGTLEASGRSFATLEKRVAGLPNEKPEKDTGKD